MTRRILGGFMAVIAVVIVGIVVPLCWRVGTQHSRDYRANAMVAARSLAAVAEEKLSDHEPGSLDDMLADANDRTDSVAVLDTAGSVVGTIGHPITASWITEARDGTLPARSDGDVLVSARVGDDDSPPVGLVVLARNAHPLDRWLMMLWSGVLMSVIVTVAVAALVGWSLARWIARPLTGLAAAARDIGSGQVGVLADGVGGPGEVREVAAAFNDMVGQVAALAEAQRSITADVSHQLRTPLAALRLRLELLRDDTEESKRGELVAMLDETERLSHLVDGLLAVARADAVVSVPVPTDVGAVSSARIAAWLPVAAERGVALVMVGSSVGAAITDGHLEQILDNLIANALESVQREGWVRLEISHTSSRAMLRLVDNGTGMTADQRARAFGRFVTDRGSRGGTGLGLAIVGRLVAADGGVARLDETPGGGLTVEVGFQLVIGHGRGAKALQAP